MESILPLSTLLQELMALQTSREPLPQALALALERIVSLSPAEHRWEGALFVDAPSPGADKSVARLGITPEWWPLCEAVALPATNPGPHHPPPPAAVADRLRVTPLLLQGERVGALVILLASGEESPTASDGTDPMPPLATALAALIDAKRRDERLQLMTKVFEMSHDAVVITDQANRIIDVNTAFTRITRCPREQALGQNPGFLKSGRHDDAFYKQMWRSLDREGRWQGELWNRRLNGEVYPQWLSIDTIKDPVGRILHSIGIFSDLSTLKSVEARLAHLAYHDPLTGLANRLLFQDRLSREIALARRHASTVAVLLLDLDRFKHANDTFGHNAGDLILVEAARRLQAVIRETDSIARMGGDEFTIILNDVKSFEGTIRAAEKILASFAHPMVVEAQEIFIGASIGIAVYPSDGDDVDTLIKNADAAMYLAKERGRNNVQFFQKGMQEDSGRRLTLESGLRRALERGELLLHYQPKVDLASGNMVGMEALVRWERPGTGLVPPGEFIALAEETGLILPMGAWILETACRQTRRWVDQGHDHLRVAVNLSARQFRSGDLVATVRDILQKTGLPPRNLELEITESMVMQDIERVIATLSEFGAMGLHISMDDFGTGYSSLSYLKRLPIHSLKIDRSFVRDLATDPDDAAIVSAIISMARNLHLKVVAEGLETLEQLAFLRQSGCDESQGYHFSRPLPVEAFTLLLEGKKPW
ncbi:MAG: EAL domain-containing protein [Magnetococcales bacterium]|nr:EAL domain-containing protein [Magnetococcales bacterium]MBF0156433.1 EAL domain-containing protein [Magnetococcales bacterium]